MAIFYDVIKGNLNEHTTLATKHNLLVAQVTRDNFNRETHTKIHHVLKRDTDKGTYEIVRDKQNASSKE